MHQYRADRVVFPMTSRVSLLICLLFVLCAPGWSALVGKFSDELDTPAYNCSFALTPAPVVASAATLTIDYHDAANFTRLRFTPARAVITTITHGKTIFTGSVTLHLQPGKTITVVVMRRAEQFGLLVDDALLFHAAVPRVMGEAAGVSADAGWTVSSPVVQRLEPVVFADDFMRTSDEAGGWTVCRGHWRLQSAWDEDPHGNSARFTNVGFAQNPFAWCGRATDADTSALCTAGQLYWDDYSFSVAERGAEGSAVGAAVNMTDGENGLLVRWSPANDRGPRGDRLVLYRVSHGKLDSLQSTEGGYIPGQWYKLTLVSALDTVSVLVDGQTRLTAPITGVGRGGVGLYTEGTAGAVFDDVRVYGHDLNTDLIAETEQARIGERLSEDAKMHNWSDANNDWDPTAGVPDTFVYRYDIAGDQWITAPVTPAAWPPDGQLSLALNGDGRTALSGYRLVLTRDTKGGTSYLLSRNTEVLVRAKGPVMTSHETYTVRLRRQEDRLWCEVDGATVVQAAHVAPLAGTRPLYRGSGAFSGVRDVVVLGRNVREYTFADAPTDWFGEGVWMPSVRWACQPQWSFLSGWSRGDAVLWHKQIFTGDQQFEAFVGIKMEYPHEADIYYDRYRNLGITICGDGRQPRSGYTGIFGAPGKDGRQNQRAVLLRNGVEVAECPYVMPGYDSAHRNWFHLELRKHDADVDFWIEGQSVLHFTDPNPISSGSPAIWTTDNGISVARAGLRFVNPPHLRTDSRVILAQPDVPEWVDVGAPLPLDFSRSWSTAGKPVTLTITPRQVPPGEEEALTITGMQATFAPKTLGNYWYEIHAADGVAISPAYHLAVTVFNPALTRDPAHQLVLYRFTEGAGESVVDRSGVAPGVDLTLSDPQNVRWLPGRGLLLVNPTSLVSPVTKKLGAIAASQACTIELWTSAGTLNPPTPNWKGTLLSWQRGGDPVNIAFGHQQSNLGLCLHATAFPFATWRYYGDQRFDAPETFRTGLHHWVLTWTGTKGAETTRIYRDGEPVYTGFVPWDTATWSPEGKITLGSLLNGQTGFLGAYYLAAIYDTAFTPERVQQHYHAGPAG